MRKSVRLRNMPSCDAMIMKLFARTLTAKCVTPQNSTTVFGVLTFL